MRVHARRTSLEERALNFDISAFEENFWDKQKTKVSLSPALDQVDTWWHSLQQLSIIWFYKFRLSFDCFESTRIGRQSQNEFIFIQQMPKDLTTLNHVLKFANLD